MRYYLFFFLLFLCNIFSQEQVSESKVIIENKIIDNKISELNLKIDSLTRIQEDYKNSILEKRIEQANETISNQSALISGFSTMYVVLTILLAVIGISLPILVYQFGIKPSQKALKEFEENADKKIEKYLVNNRNNQINKAIENISGNNTEYRNNAVSYLTLTSHEGFLAEQIDKIINLINSGTLSEFEEASLVSSICNTKHSLTTIFFKKVFEEKKTNLYYQAFSYFQNIKSKEYLKELKKILIESKNRANDFLLFSIYFSQQSNEELISYINNTDFVNILTDKELIEINEQLEAYKRNTWKIDNLTFENSYLNKKIMLVIKK